MRLTWAGANVVVTARNHNPTIVAPAWVQAHRVIDEPAENFTLTPIFALYQSVSFQLLVEPERLQFALRGLSEANLEGLTAGVSNYVQQLPHVPYAAVGINFVWKATSEHSGEVPKLLDAQPSERERVAFPGGELRKGVLLLHRTDSYLLKLVGTPTKDDGLSLDFNFHYEVKGAEAALRAIRSVRACYDSGLQAANRLLGLQVNA